MLGIMVGLEVEKIVFVCYVVWMFVMVGSLIVLYFMIILCKGYGFGV